MATNFSQKSRKKYICEKCDFYSNNKTDYIKHINTIKHASVRETNEWLPISRKNLAVFKNEVTNDNSNELYMYACQCGKKYKHKSSLYKHIKICNILNKESKESKEIVEYDSSSVLINTELKDIVCTLIRENKGIRECLIKENDELKKQLKEKDFQINSLIPKIGNCSNNTSNTNNTNNTSNINNNIKQRFNINIFLNEKCRDAISIDEFISKIEVSMKDLLITRDKGLSEGLSNIIIDNINKLSLYERPMHCTDKKRETLYIKEDDFVKDENYEKINNVLKNVINKQLKTIKEWIKDNPHYNEDEKLKDQYIELVTKCTSSLCESERKLIKNICNSVYLENK